jgi:hypothetical protein
LHEGNEVAIKYTQLHSILARILHEGNEVTTGILPSTLRASRAVQIRSGRICQGKYGKTVWVIARRSIAIAMGESDEGKVPVDLSPDERVAHG